ncbi:allergen Tha p 1-like [Melitaea cinxia]|uniref:allergen Tha p 1-like n=1 Tax=Melitaea cinxia TaxID=113334 RepID=UPI001E27299E|nr:allergen Tha p 1-like [Melitaea cinxia]
MMKLLIVLAFVAVVAARPDVDYNRYENFNVDEVIENRRLFKAYVECLQGVGKCTPEGNDLKTALPDGIQNSCSKCSEKLKTLVAKLIIAAQEQYPEEWESINKQYNPNGEHNEKMKEFLEKYKP